MSWSDPCPPCPRKYRAIGGDGPQPAHLLAIGERPGPEENRNGRVFIHKTGQELDQTYLPLAGLRRPEIRVCNAVRCWAENNRTPSAGEVLACARHHLPGELERTRPEAVILMGGSACRLVPGVRLDMHHGIPQHTRKVGSLLGWEGWIVPVFHPALGIHEGRWMTQLLEDWEELGRVLGESDWREDPKPCPVSYRIIHGKDVRDYLHSVMHARIWTGAPGVDTENHGPKPFSSQFSLCPHTGRLILAEDEAGLACFNEWARDQEFAFHHVAHDLDVAEKMRVMFPHYRDTMQEAFQLGNLPQGLKALTYRLFRQTMTSWEDTVRPASILKLREWMTEALLIAIADLRETEIVVMKTRVKEVEKASGAEGFFTRLLRHTQVDSEYDPWERLTEFAPQNEKVVAHLEARIGPYPILGIGNCTQEQAVRYAVGDADWTGQVAAELERRRNGNTFAIAEEDEDK